VHAVFFFWSREGKEEKQVFLPPLSRTSKRGGSRRSFRRSPLFLFQDFMNVHLYRALRAFFFPFSFFAISSPLRNCIFSGSFFLSPFPLKKNALPEELLASVPQ